MFLRSQAKIVWLLDRLDESTNSELMHRFLRESIELYSESTFIVLSREEGKETLREVRDHMVEYTLDKLDESQCLQFVDVFPFSGNAKEMQLKKEKLTSALETNSSMKSAFSIPINAVMICRLFDDNGFDGVVGNGVDIFMKLLGSIAKACDDKLLDKKLITCEKGKESDALSLEKQSLIEKSIADVLADKRRLLEKLGHAIFFCNGSSLIGFQDIPQRDLKKQLHHLSLTDEEVSFL